LKPQALLELSDKDTPRADGNCQPPSISILSVFNKYKVVPPLEVIEDTAQKVLLSVDETKMWFEHLNQIAENRAKGAKKAAETRRKKKAQANNSTTNDLPGQSSESTENICLICDMADPPLSDDEDVDGVVPWIICDGCASWCHMVCANIPSSEVPNHWLCINCQEV
jgi:hypothetical protein